MNDNLIRYSTPLIDTSVLSVLDVELDGKVVSASDWKNLWELVFARINDISTFCAALEELRIDWLESEEALEATVTKFNAKYDSLAKSFVHYGATPPTDEHIKLWIKPVSDVEDSLTVTHKEMADAIADKVVAFAPTDSNVLSIPLEKTMQLEYNSSYLIERFRVKDDLTKISVAYPVDNFNGTAYYMSTEEFVIPTDTDITMIHTRNSGGLVDGSFRITVTVLFNGPILYTPSFRNNEVCTGYYEITGLVGADGTVTDLDITFYETASTSMLTPPTRVTNVTLAASKWSWDSSKGAYVQQVSIPNVTIYSKVNMQLTVKQLSEFHDKDITFVVLNEDRIINVYCIGEVPTTDYTVQLTIEEVLPL